MYYSATNEGEHTQYAFHLIDHEAHVPQMKWFKKDCSLGNVGLWDVNIKLVRVHDLAENFVKMCNHRVLYFVK